MPQQEISRRPSRRAPAARSVVVWGESERGSEEAPSDPSNNTHDSTVVYHAVGACAGVSKKPQSKTEPSLMPAAEATSGHVCQDYSDVTAARGKGHILLLPSDPAEAEE